MLSTSAMFLLAAVFGILLMLTGALTVWWVLDEAREGALEDAIEDAGEREALVEETPEEPEVPRRDVAA